MSIKFNYTNRLYQTNADVYVKSIGSVRRLYVVADTGCQYTTTDIYTLIDILGVPFESFISKYANLFKIKSSGSVVLGDGSRVNTKLVCLPNMVLRSQGLSPEKFERFYCKVMFPINVKESYLKNLDTYNSNKDVGVTRLFLGHNVIRACQSFTFYDNYAYMSGFNYNTYSKLS